MAKWNVATVEELVESGIIERPLDGNHGEIHPKSSDFVEFGVPFLMASDIKHDRVDLDSCARISEQQAMALRKGFAKNGDVLLTHKGTLGRTALLQGLDTPYAVLTPQVTYYRVKDTNQLNPSYLMYYFQSSKFQAVLSAWAGSGSTRAYLSITDQQKLPVVLPPIQIQEQISSVLAVIDDKIDLNRRMNETLEHMAMTAYKHWFIDTESPERVPLAELIEINPKISMKKGYEIPFVDMKAVSTNSLSVQDADVVMKQFTSGSKFQNGDTLFARITPCLENGKTAYVDFLEEDGIAFGSTEFLVLRAKSSACPAFVYCTARFPNFKDYAIKSMVGTSGRQRAQVGALLQFEIPAPDHEAMIRFAEITKEWFQQIRSNTIENRYLYDIRGNLLPRLLSGEIYLNTDEAII
ncbi:restriction endonuclease subunit S [Alicyclobacillus ferrooxydans]|nr:restriction endonuclease subunit S [Alicyclobacillus ferrooxydans]